jgi:hypothetical protein
MTTVFIGPYRQYDYIGQASKTYLRSIHSVLVNRGLSFIGRPLFSDPGSIDENNTLFLDKIEKVPNTLELNAIIQHAPVEYLAVQKYTKNIAIPIIDNKLFKTPYNQNYQKLNSFDNILVENDHQKTLLIKSNIICPIIVFDEYLQDKDISDHTNKKYNLGPKVNDSFIFGFIGYYRQNISIIQKIITSFLVSFRSSDDTVLLICCKGTEQDRQELDSYYQNTKNKLNIIDHNNIIFVFNQLNIESAIASLNTFNCFLSLNDDYSQNLYDKYAISNNISVITKHSLETAQIPSTFADESCDIEDTMMSILTSDLCKKLIDIKNQKNNMNKQQKIKKNNKNLGETICHILQ